MLQPTFDTSTLNELMQVCEEVNRKLQLLSNPQHLDWC